MVIEFSSQPIDLASILLYLSQRKHALSFIAPNLFACGRNDRDYYCDRYTYCDT